MTQVTLTIPGPPYPKKRHRHATIRGKTRPFNPATNERFESVVRQIAAPHFPGPLTGPVRVDIVAVFAPPRSWSKRKVAEHMHRPHTQKPDRDNLEKAVLDGLNRIAFADDAQVADGRTRKVWGPVAQTIITIEPMTFAGMIAAHDASLAKSEPEALE
jgi:Holliday junction resolvase RusA-like endonuclease